MKTEENTDKKLYVPPDFYVLNFNETKGGQDFEDVEDLEAGSYSLGGA